MIEDLRKRHFKMFDRKRGMDVPHTTLVLQELGRLHAATLLLEKKLGCPLTEKWPIIVEKWLTGNDSKMAELFQKMVESQMEASAMIMEKVSSRDIFYLTRVNMLAQLLGCFYCHSNT